MPPNAGTAGHVFVSYASEDRDEVTRLVTSLEAVGVPCWIAPRDVPPFSDYAEQISKAIETAAALLLMYSASARASSHCLREVELAIRHGLPTLPVRLDDTPISGGYEYRLATVQWVNASTPELLRKLSRVLHDAIGRPDSGTGAELQVQPRARSKIIRLAPRISARETELTRIRVLLDDVSETKRGRLLLIHGNSGVGKSILAEATAAEAAARGFVVAATVCEPFHEGMSFFAVGELTRQLTRHSTSLAELSAIYGPESFEASMATLAEPDNVDPGARRDATLATFANLAIGRTLPPEGQPVLLVIDDLERTDPGTTDSLLCLLARLQEAPVLIVGTYRSDVVMAQRPIHPLTPLITAAARAGERTVDVQLGPVERSDMRDIVESILDGKSALAHSFLDQLWRETEGNPLYIREILRALQDKRSDGGAHLLRVNNEWKLVGDLQEWQTPASVEDAIRTRLDLMEPISRTEMERAAVVGRRFAFSVMRQLTDADEDSLLSRLEECISLSLIQEVTGADESFEFTHGKIRDVLYESMSRIRRRKLHSVVADALLALRSTITEDWDALIGEHLYQSGRFGEALPMLRSAAERLLKLSASREAAVLLGKALEAHNRSGGPAEQLAELRLSRVNALISANEYDAALELASATVGDPASDIISRGWALDFIGDIEWAKGRREEALEAYRAAEDIAVVEKEAALELEACADLAELCYRSSEQLAGIRDDEAATFAELFEKYLARELILSESATDLISRARALRNEAKRLRRYGEVDGAIAKYEEALELTDPRVATHSVLISYAKTLRFANRADDAVQVVDRVLSWSTQSGARRSLAIALHYRAILKFEAAGPLASVKDDLNEALAIHKEIGYDRGIWEVSTLLGEWYAASGDRPAALRFFRAALKAGPEIPDSDVITRVRRQLEAIEEAARAQKVAAAWS